MTIPVAIFTADHRHDVLRVMLWLYAKYWNWPAVVYGFKKPAYAIEDNISFESLGDMRDYPADKWSDAIIKALDSMATDQVIILLEDYWLTRKVNVTAVRYLGEYMQLHRDIVRGDLTTDRLYAGDLVEIEPYGHIDIIANDPPPQYHFSTQAAIWNKDLLRRFMRPNETPWQAELSGTTRMLEAMQRGEPARTVGTRQFPVRYLIAVQQGKLALDGGYQVPAPVMRQEDKDVAIALMEMSREDYAFAGMAK